MLGDRIRTALLITHEALQGGHDSEFFGRGCLEGALTPFIAQSKKNGKFGARESRSSVGMSMCHSFFSSSQYVTTRRYF